MQWRFGNLRTRHRVTLVLVLISAVAVAAYFLGSKLVEFNAWHDPLSMRQPKNLWARSRAGLLQATERATLEGLLEAHSSLLCPRWERRVIRYVLADVVDYPKSLNPPPRISDVGVVDRREEDQQAQILVLRELVEDSPRSTWADENWEAIERWLTVNIGNLQVNEQATRFVLTK